ncbi:MAG: hypothetical protein HPZ91_10290 [Lentisphaeria bacterium]|nr:hypothetical protein [Lentisphaeria bacterium]
MSAGILFLGAHLDDAVIAAGGTIRAFAEAGCEVSVVCFGNGDEAFTEPGGREKAVERFKRDAARAYEILGVRNFECCDVPDFAVAQNRESYRQCIAAIRRYKPELIFGHGWAEYFQHHEMASVSRDAYYQSGWACSADLGAPHQARRYFHFEVLQELAEPTHYIDVSRTFECKLRAWAQFESAQEHLGSLARQLESRAAWRGAKIGASRAEAFRQCFYLPEVVRDVKELL